MRHKRKKRLIKRTLSAVLCVSMCAGGMITAPVKVSATANVEETDVSTFNNTAERMDISQSEITATADSAQEAASNAVDGNQDTKWHTSWAAGHSTVPLSIVLDLGKVHENITQVRYLPRQDMKSGSYQWNGDILGYEIRVSETDTDESSFTKVAEGTWEGDKNEKSATFASVAARYVKLTAVHTKGNNANEYDQFASAAEINIAEGGTVDLDTEKQALADALARAKAFLDAASKTDTELINLRTLIKEAEILVADGYMATEEALVGTAEALNAETERLETDAPVISYDSFTLNGDWQDTSGTRIQAHGGGIIWDEVTEKYYWYGEHKGEDSFSAAIGISCYSSTDLYNWKNEGLALPVFNNPAFLGEDYTAETPLYLAESSEEYQQAKADGKAVSTYDTLEKYNSASRIAKLNALYDGVSAAEKKALYTKLNWNCVLERPKVIYNETTQQYVMWFHKDGEGVGKYNLAQTGIAVSDSPTGPFKLVDSINPNGFESRDMTLFKDDDGKAYLLHSSEGNKTLYIAELNDEYTGLTGNYSRNYVDSSGSMAVFAREAPSIFKYEGKYYLISSGCTGWDPNQMGYSVTDDITAGMSANGGNGPFQMDNLQNPCIGTDADISYYGQSTFVLPVQGKEGCFIYMGDKWNKYNLKDSRYQWLPIQIDAENSALTLAWNAEWTLDAFAALNTEARKTLNAAVKKGKALSEEEYGGTEKWTAFQELLYQAGDLDYDASEKDVISMAEAVAGAAENIETWGALESALEKVENLFDGDYTPETWAAVQEAYEAGKILDQEASKEEIKAAAEAIEAAAAALVKLDIPTETVDLSDASITADSAQNGNEAEKAIDGDGNTIWHSAWGSGQTPLPHYITIDLGKPVDNLYQLTYLPRQDKSSNGNATRYKIMVSNGAEDGSAPSDEDFVSVRTGTWADDKTEKSASFRTDGAVRYVRFIITGGHGDFASAAEIGLKTRYEVSIDVNKESLRRIVEMAEKLENGDQAFTEESWNALEAALTEARKVLEREDASQNEVDDAWMNLLTAYSNLENGVQKTGLQMAIDNAEVLLKDEEAMKNYTSESIQEVEKALETAKTVLNTKYDDVKAGQTAVNQATENLITAVTQLLKKDYGRLEKLIEQAEKLLEKDDRFTPESVKKLQDAVNAARDIIEQKKDTEDIDQAYAALMEAMTNLQLKGNKSELEAALKKAKEILDHKDRYLASTLEGLEEAYNSAEAVYADDNAVQKEIEQVLEALIRECMEARLLGDVDLNGVVDTADSAYLLMHFAELTELNQEQLLVGDVNGDGENDTEDASAILRLASEKISSF